MANSGGVGGGGGFQAGLQRLLQAGQQALQRVRGGEKGADAKGDVKGDAKAGTTGGSQGAGGIRAKGKARGKDLDGVERLIAGSDDYAVEDEEKDKRRRQRFVLGDDQPNHDFREQDSTEDRSSVAHISAEFRGQVASGMVAGRSFTQGSCLVPDQAPDLDDEEEPPRKKRR